MKMILRFLTAVTLLAVLCVPASADGFSLDEKAVMKGMDGRSWYQGYQPSTQYGNYTICLPLRSDTAEGNIEVSLTLNDPELYLFSRQPGTITVSPRNGIYPVSISVPLMQNRRNGDYPASITINGQTAAGDPITQIVPHIIRIRDGYASLESLNPTITASGSLQVGQNGTFLLTISNPTKTLSMTDCTLSLTDASGDVLMVGPDVLSFPEILPSETVTIEIPVAVKGNAAVEMHSFEVKLIYQVLGRAESWELKVSHPVTQEIRLEQGAISLPTTAIQGELTTLSVPLMNLGKGDICNAMVSLEFPWMNQRQSVLVGTIEPGATGQAKLTFSPSKDAIGDYSGMVSISCEDAWGSVWEQEEPVRITVEKAAAMTEPTPEPVIHTPKWVLPIVSILCVLLFAGIILQGAILGRKLHKLEEERL